MKINAFEIKGRFPAFDVTVLVDDQGDSRSVYLGPWDYVSTLNATQLKALVKTSMSLNQTIGQKTQAMSELEGEQLDL